MFFSHCNKIHRCKKDPKAIYYVRMKRKFNLHDGFRPSALTGRDYAFNNLTWGLRYLTHVACQFILYVTHLPTAISSHPTSSIPPRLNTTCCEALLVTCSTTFHNLFTRNVPVKKIKENLLDKIRTIFRGKAGTIMIIRC